MGTNIYPVSLGFDRAYIIKDQGTIMIDGGAPNQAKAFSKALKNVSIRPEEVQLIVLTHGHWDHVGSAREIKEITGAQIAMHQREKHWLESSLKPMPPGVSTWGHIFGGIVKVFLPFIRIPAADVDVVLGDEEVPLAKYGIPGKVVYTPGHSSGSVSVLLETGEVFVGDMAMNKFPLRLSPGLPIFAEDWEQLMESWKQLLDQGVKTIYPSHGELFPAEIIREALS
jgi:glyoxylase-like metal-dependent hydrolase (beta-lactamase superfamily II)